MLELLILERLLLAMLLGAIIGYERERAHKAAGLRTHILVCISATLITLVALYAFENNTAEASSRIIANVIVGIGFIGGGAILRHESHILGTTTAATLWTVAAIGIAVGVGFTFAALLVTLVGYLTLTILWRLEARITGSNHELDSDHEHRANL